MFLRALLVTAFGLAAAAAAVAQDTRASGASSDTGGAPPAEVRMGAFRPLEADPRSVAALPALPAGRDYKVGPNDLIDIEILDLDNLKRTVRVNAAGAISLPLVGAVQVAGLTSHELEQRLAERYREKYLQNPQVSVFIKEFTSERITVEGAVNKPGIFPLTGQITLLRALALAGGFGPIANSGEVMLFRNSDGGRREVAVFDVDLIRAGKADDPPLKGDDLIVVQRDHARRMLKDSLFRDIVDSFNPFSLFARP